MPLRSSFYVPKKFEGFNGLCVAVICQAVEDLRRSRWIVRNVKGKSEKIRRKRGLAQDEIDKTIEFFKSYGFNELCDLLNLEPSTIRSKLQIKKENSFNTPSIHNV